MKKAQRKLGFFGKVAADFSPDLPLAGTHDVAIDHPAFHSRYAKQPQRRSKEIDKFSELAHRWWDPNSEFKPLHDLNPLRLGWIDDIAHLSGKQVIDVGCGGGILSESMARAALPCAASTCRQRRSR
jgi:2-polyprenyl-6-hydroxyphenyl methylase/3-demethylubiquinone-9 3-methyltransferase